MNEQRFELALHWIEEVIDEWNSGEYDEASEALAVIRDLVEANPIPEEEAA